MLSDAEIASMSAEQRAQLSHRLAALNTGLIRETEAGRKRRRRVVDVLVVTCIGMIPWIVILGVTLPRNYVAHHWTLAWVGFDVALLAALCITAWAAWRRRQIVIIAALVTGTLLLTDAWFDIVTDSSTRDLIESVVTAVVAEVPLAALMFNAAFRLIRFSTHNVRSLAGDIGDIPLRKVPILGIDPLDGLGK